MHENVKQLFQSLNAEKVQSDKSTLTYAAFLECMHAYDQGLH